MAYAQSAPVITSRIRGDGLVEFTARFTEAEVAAGSTWSLAGMPVSGTITLCRVAPTFTTGATVQPAYGRAVGWALGGANIDHIGQVSAAAASSNDASGLRYAGLTSGTLYGRSVPNAGSDTSTTVEITIVDGHI
jgi:hypothetical protein